MLYEVITFEGKVRMRNAEIGIASLKPAVDTLITIPNDKLIDLVGRASVITSYSIHYTKLYDTYVLAW